jgi:serine/threonine protein kinase
MRPAPSGTACRGCGQRLTPPPGRASVLCPACGQTVVIDALLGKTIAGYSLQARLGSGAVSMVYAALDGRRDQARPPRVAVKMLTRQAAQDEENARRFRREAELMRSIHHPNVVRAYEHGCEHGVHYLVMEMVDGESMEQAIERRKRLPWREAMGLIQQVAQALEHLLRHGIIHRDVKPANILLDRQGLAKLVDLGFAKRLLEGDSDVPGGDSSLTVQGISMGSPAYMPPEQVLDAKLATTTADVYSLGATLFHAITGETPFRGTSAYAVMEQVLRDPPLPPSSLVGDLPPAVDALILWCLDKRPDRRPAHPARLVQEMEVVMSAPDDARRVHRQRRQQARTWQVPVVVGSAVLVVGALFAFLWRHHS